MFPPSRQTAAALGHQPALRHHSRLEAPVNLVLLVGVACAVLFFRAADYEHMNPWAWSVASLGLTGIVRQKSPSLMLLLLAQVALFGVMWWYNVRRRNRKPK
jgi:hypothetical protein